MTITTLPTAPTPADSTSVFNDRAFALVAALANFVTEVNATALDVDADAGVAAAQAGVATTQAGVATAQAGVALGHATDAGVAQTAAEAAQAAAEAAVATLPPGTINDLLVGPTTAWSSEKTNAEILLAKNYPGDVLRTARVLSAPEYLPCDGAAYLKSSYPDLADEIGFLCDAVWTERTSSYSSYGIYGAAYGAGMYVTCGASNKVASSPDGVTWTQRTSGLATGDLYAAIYADGRFVVAGAGAGCAYSANGTSWTVGGTISGAILALAYGAGLYVAVGNVGQLYTSPTAVTWTGRTSSFGSSGILSVVYGAGVFVATGANGKIATSPDGITWTQRTSPFLGTETVARVLFDGGKFVAFAQASGGIISKIATSPDGITWTLVASVSHPGYGGTGLAFDGQLYVLIAGSYIYVSDDGVNWVLDPTPLPATNTQNLVSAGGLFLATGGTGKLFTSPGLTYDPATQFVTPVIAAELSLTTYIKA